MGDISGGRIGDSVPSLGCREQAEPGRPSGAPLRELLGAAADMAAADMEVPDDEQAAGGGGRHQVHGRAGAGVALRGALALDPEHYEIVFITGTGDDLVAKAREAGHEVVLMPHLRSEIAPADDRRAFADLRACLKDFDVVHTHSSKAGALGPAAAHRAG